jgi:hypothetical protein
MNSFELILKILSTEEDLTAREIAKRANALGEKWVRKDANSNLYRMLSQGLVERVSTSKVPTWRIRKNEVRSKVVSSGEILSLPRKSTARSLRELVHEEAFSIALPKVRISFAYDTHSSANDPYIQGDWLSEMLFITVNVKHPFWETFIDSEEEKLLFLQFAAQDAYIQWQVAQRGNAVSYQEIISFRDSVLREIAHLRVERI